MSPQPPCEPESSPNATRVLHLAEALSRISQTILEHSSQLSADNLPNFSQLVLQRGQIIAELNTLGDQATESLSEPERQQLSQQLEAALSVDTAIEKHMAAYKADASGQIKALKDASALLNKYRATPRDTSGSQNRNA